jgi:hypothetical protein
MPKAPALEMEAVKAASLTHIMAPPTIGNLTPRVLATRVLNIYPPGHKLFVMSILNVANVAKRTAIISTVFCSAPFEKNVEGHSHFEEHEEAS